MTMIDVMTKPASELGITDDMQAFMRFAWATSDRKRSMDQLIEEFNKSKRLFNLSKRTRAP